MERSARRGVLVLVLREDGRCPPRLSSVCWSRARDVICGVSASGQVEYAYLKGTFLLNSSEVKKQKAAWYQTTIHNVQCLESLLGLLLVRIFQIHTV